MEKELTPTEALAILDNVISQVSTSREGHKKIEEAVLILGNFVKEFTPKKEEK